MEFVYLLLTTDTDGQNELYKIGITSKNVNKRIKSLSTGNPNIITLIHVFESKYYKKIEKWLHCRYVQNKTASKNEWFHLNDNDVISFKENCENTEKTIIFMENNNTFLNKITP